ncbi:unnamed protein product [Symbiodinium necroappetens]|uniref:Glycosyltransferase n=1 Tax=Symbiodinium necroappetens TaxID=1628268 RepID=A0A813A9R6_9DINO|nr:unnamed protein product [Symbiodinium necroappetens]
MGEGAKKAWCPCAAGYFAFAFSCAQSRRMQRVRATGGKEDPEETEEKSGFLGKLRKRLPKKPTKEEMKKYGAGMVFSYSFVGTLNMCMMVALSWPVFIMRTGGSPILFSPLKLKPQYMVYLTAVYFSYGSCTTPFLLAFALLLAPFFSKLLGGFRKRLGCSKWLAFVLMGLLMAVCYLLALPFLIALACWRRHAHQLCGEPVLISDENVRTYIPDMPTEYFRMPYSQAKSDIIRYALLYHHGGIYMDTDFLVVQDLDEVIDLAQSYDLVSYMDEGSGSLEKGSLAAWQLMETHCPLSDKEKEKVCCFDDDRTQCHIPWAGIGEGVSHPVFDELEGDGVRFKSFCFSDERGFTPPDMINMLEKAGLG